MQSNPSAAPGLPGRIGGVPIAVFAEPASPEEAVIGLLMQAGRRLRTRHPADGVDPSTFPLAKQLLHRDEGMRVSDLATCVELDSSTVSRQIKQLEDKGIVERTADPADGRASLVRLTAEGRAIMLAAFRRRFERIKTVLEPWSDDDRELLKTLLTRLAADLGAASDEAAAEAAAHPTTQESN